MKSEKGGEVCIKCALGRLLPSLELRSAIENVVERMHIIALRGSYVATETFINASKSGVLPHIDQTWWYRCFASTYTSPGSNEVSDPAIRHAARKLFGNVQPVNGYKIWSFVSELSRDALTMTQNMVASSFHIQVMKRREIYIVEANEGIKMNKEDKYKTVQHFSRRAVGHINIPNLPSTVSDHVREPLEELLRSWTEVAKTVLPCPTEDFIYNDKKRTKLQGLLKWMQILNDHRSACLSRMQAIVSDAEEARKRFGKSARAQAPLPFFSWKVKHIAINRTGFKDLLSTVGVRASEDVSFAKHLPGLERIAKHHPFKNYMRTDGVSVSLVVDNGCKEARKRKKHQPKNTPEYILPQCDQRIVAIDPGRRDMIACCSNQEDVPFTVSTKSVEVKTGRLKARINSQKVLRRDCVDGHPSLLARLCSLSSRRDNWNAFLHESLPILQTIAETYRVRSLRRHGLASYMKRDQALDEICKRICGGTLRNQKGQYRRGQLGTIVAFGAANACFTGFGYAPAPQSRLRFRLEKIHGAKVFLVNEYNTSKLCSRCHSGLHEVTMQNTNSKGEVKKVKPHGIRYCSTCKNDKGASLFWHRDINAARNIMTCYLEIAESGFRPEPFSRKNNRQSDTQIACGSTEPQAGSAVGFAFSEARPSKQAKRAL